MKRWRYSALVALFFAALYTTACWFGAGRLLMPPRKELPSWSFSGMRIAHGTSARGTPYLLCTPDPASGPGERGRILRLQLGAAKTRPFGEVAGTVILLHGWGMRKEALLSSAERFCAAGLRCVIPDLPGHGENPAPATGFGTGEAEGSLPGEVLDSASAKFHFPGQPAALWGLSMGGAYAVQAAAQEPGRWKALVVVSSFDALAPVVDGAMDGYCRGLSTLVNPGLDLAVRARGGFWLSEVRPVEKARRLALPTLVLHGTADDLIPIREGRRLYEAVADSRKRWIEVDAARHGNVLGTPQHVFVEMAAWYAQWLFPPRPQAATAKSTRSETRHDARPRASATPLIAASYDAPGSARR
jgi:pimeloyl-ACP methyl ester carboxylesterase